MNSVRPILLTVSLLCLGCSKTAAVAPIATARTNPSGADGLGSQQQSRADEQTSTEPIRYTVRKATAPLADRGVPKVLLTEGHAKLCKVGVGDPFPEVALPRLGGPTTRLSNLMGERATVVLFWHPDRWMARTALVDLQRDIASQFDSKQVSVVGVAVRQASGAVQAALNSAKASFPQLLDTDGKAFAAIGTAGLPRIYVLDPAGKIIWFDIEYSEGSRRELWQTLGVLTKSK